MPISIYIAHDRTVPPMRPMRRILLKQVRLQWATETGDAEFWIICSDILSFRFINGTRCKWPGCVPVVSLLPKNTRRPLPIINIQIKNADKAVYF